MQLLHERPAIGSVQDLRVHLQWAIEVEHATIPSYLCALYTLDADRNPEAAEVIHSVLLEEMLHLALAANLLNAVGGRPRLDAPHLLPGYPRALPHRSPELMLSLLPFGTDALDLFLEIEQPCTPDAPPQADGYATIGQFHGAIRLGLLTLTAELGEAAVFCGDPDRQVSDREFRGGPGRIFEVTDLPTALAALDLIVEQGEGAEHVEVWDGDADMFHPDRAAVGHYYRFQQLASGRRFQQGDTPRDGPTGSRVLVDWDAARPMRRDARATDFAEGSAVRRAMDEFNSTYCRVLHRLERAFDGDRDRLGDAIATMYALKAAAEELLSLPVSATETAGPSFEYVRPEDRR